MGQQEAEIEEGEETPQHQLQEEQLLIEEEEILVMPEGRIRHGIIILQLEEKGVIDEEILQDEMYNNPKGVHYNEENHKFAHAHFQPPDWYCLTFFANCNIYLLIL